MLVADALSLDHATTEEQAAAARVPARPYVSQQIGCSDLAPLLIAWAVADRPAVHVPLPSAIGDWMRVAIERARRWAERPVPRELAGHAAVWCSERGRLVRVARGRRLPEIVAVKAGLRERAPQASYQRAGHDLEPLLWRTWADSEPRVRDSRYALDGVPVQWRETYRAPSVRMAAGPLVTYPDGWAWTWEGQLVVVNCKTTVKPKDAPDPPAWLQIQGEIAVTGADLGVLPHGIGWAADYRSDPVETRPTRAFWIEPERRTQAALVAFAAAAMEWIAEEAAERKDERE